MTVKNTNISTKVGLLFSYYMVLSFWAAQTLSMSMLSRNVGGQTKKSVVVAANFVAWATGNAIGPQVFLSWDSPRYFIAFATHMGCYVLLVIVIVFLRWHLVSCNNKKDALAAAGDQAANDDHLVHAFDDLTDRVSRTVMIVAKPVTDLSAGKQELPIRLLGGPHNTVYSPMGKIWSRS
jgi:hypothetical protein